MSQIAATADAFISRVRDQLPTPRRVWLLSVSCLVVGLGISAWQFFGGFHSQQLDRSMLGMIIPAVLGAGGFAAAMLIGQNLWRQEVLKQLRSKEEEVRKSTTGLQLKLVESRKAVEEAQQTCTESQAEATRLAQANAQLRTELDQLRKAEKNLSQRRQELESSKTVLELHVQERARELQKLQRQYELILNSAGEGICGLDVDGKATFVNPAVTRITGWDVNELIGKTEQEIFGQNGSTGQPEDKGTGERVFHRKDGSCLPLEYVKTPINENGRLVGSVLVFKDITERKRVEDAIGQKAVELARSNAELEQFAFVASHDLQEPLRKIQAFGDRLKTRVEGAIAPEAQDYLERMQSAAARMRTLINDLLTFSRVIRRSEPFASVDLTAVTKGVLGDLEVRIEKSGARVEVGELPMVEADSIQMHQLLLNLIGNALKFQPAGAQPVVKVTSRSFAALSGEQFCEISVTDNGIGFDEKYMDKIFAVFQRLHGRNEYEGTGVGLAVCRRIADRHHGTVTAKSQLGQGATFIVTLPVRQPKVPSAT